jgi:hypothetical protein
MQRTEEQSIRAEQEEQNRKSRTGRAEDSRARVEQSRGAEDSRAA